MKQVIELFEIWLLCTGGFLILIGLSFLMGSGIGFAIKYIIKRTRQ